MWVKFGAGFDPLLISITAGRVLTRYLTDVWWSTASQRQLQSLYRHLPTERVSVNDSCVAEINAMISRNAGKP